MRFRTGVLPGKRAELVDFGYWYCPDGRDAQTQSQFEDVEGSRRHSTGCSVWRRDIRFNVSCDNLEGDFEPDRVNCFNSGYMRR